MTQTMTVDERISLCRFLEKVEEQEAYCTSIGVRDISKLRGKNILKEGEKCGLEVKNKRVNCEHNVLRHISM